MNGEINLKHFLSNGYVTKRDRLLSLILPFYGFIIAKRVYTYFNKQQLHKSNSLESTTFASYTGKNEVVKKIQTLFQTTPNNAIVAALVHGSIGDQNDILYSDFDGILLIDLAKIQDAKQLQELRQLIKKTELIFLEQDALQHHSWALFTTSELKQFKDHLFPFNLIRKGKCIFPEKQTTIEFQLSSDKEQYKLLLTRLCTSILHKTTHLHTLKNQYIFKNLLSEIMLLPAAFLQAKHLQSIDKSDSFSRFKNEFPKIDIEIINWSSELRLKWKQDKTSFINRIFHRFKRIGIPLSYLAPQTPKDVYYQLNDNWKQQVNKLCETLLKNVD